MSVAIDNDVLLKGAWYGLLDELVSVIPSTPSETLVLGQAKYVVGKRLQRQLEKSVSGAEGALAGFREMLPKLSEAEPTPEEIALASDLEYSAQNEGLALDSGESLLCAITVHRALDKLATGDKRAIRALEILSARNRGLNKIAGRLVCLEQLFTRLLASHTPTVIRTAVCSYPQVDPALTNCFGCTTTAVRPADWEAGLSSYIGALRLQAPTVLEP